ncbi:hypothetical protein RB597_010326 [Gaeumannomyces tritici]
MPSPPSRQQIELGQGQQIAQDTQFFDGHDDTTESRVKEYRDWRSDFKAVYNAHFAKDDDNKPYLPTHPVKIAVLDTGVDLKHMDIKPEKQRIIKTYNWVDETCSHDVSDGDGHGTFIASLLLDYARHSQLYVAKIAESSPGEPLRAPPQDLVAKALRYAVDTWKVDIVSMSFGYPGPEGDSLNEAIRHAHNNKVLMFASASNGGDIKSRSYPGDNDHVICIHATTAKGRRSSFSVSPKSSDVNIATIGEAIESAWPVDLCTDTNGCKILHKSGTSFATPIAVGLAVTLIQYVQRYLPKLAYKMKERQTMRTILRGVAFMGPDEQKSDGYSCVVFSLHKHNFFGNTPGFIYENLEKWLRS